MPGTRGTAIILVSFALPALVACNEERAPSESGSGEPTKLAGPAGLPLALTPPPSRVRTAVDTGPTFFFGIPASFGRGDAYLKLVAAHSRFVSAAGEVVGADVQLQEGKLQEPGLGNRFSIRPSQELLASTWYGLEVTADAKELVLASEDGAQVTTGIWRASFFTASAVHVSKAMVSSKSPLVLHVDFTEPVELSTLESKGFVRQNGASVGGCPLIGGQCLTSTAAAMESVDFELAKAIDLGATLDLVLPGGTMGAGLSVAGSFQGAGFGGEWNGASLVTKALSQEWSSCQGTAAKCWTWPGVEPSK